MLVSLNAYSPIYPSKESSRNTTQFSSRHLKKRRSRISRTLLGMKHFCNLSFHECSNIKTSKLRHFTKVNTSQPFALVKAFRTITRTLPGIRISLIAVQEKALNFQRRILRKRNSSETRTVHKARLTDNSHSAWDANWLQLHWTTDIFTIKGFTTLFQPLNQLQTQSRTALRTRQSRRVMQLHQHTYTCRPD